MLHHMLGSFAEAGLNLTKIESRSSRRKAWEHAFYLDADGHPKQEPLAGALQSMSAECELVKVLESHPPVEV